MTQETQTFVDLKEGEVVVDDGDELYLRVCPGHLQDREPSALMFRESSRDAGALSGTRSSKSTPQASFEWHAARAASGGRQAPIATYGLAIDQIRQVAAECGVPLRVVDDSAVCDPNQNPPGHAILDQRHLGDKPSHPDKRRLRALLFREASKAGALWPKESSSPNPA